MSHADVLPSPVEPVSAGSNTTSSLKAAIFQRLHPRVYLERFVAENVRPDGRQFAEWRDVSINVGTSSKFYPTRFSDMVWKGSISTADGSALVRMGHTTVVCGVKAEIAEPELERPNEGFLGTILSLSFQSKHARIYSYYSAQPRPPSSLFIQIQTRTTIRRRTGPLRQTKRSDPRLWHAFPLVSLHTPRESSLGALRRRDV